MPAAQGPGGPGGALSQAHCGLSHHGLAYNCPQVPLCLDSGAQQPERFFRSERQEVSPLLRSLQWFLTSAGEQAFHSGAPVFWPLTAWMTLSAHPST